MIVLKEDSTKFKVIQIMVVKTNLLKEEKLYRYKKCLEICEKDMTQFLRKTK
jgi:hypothetical protein